MKKTLDYYMKLNYPVEIIRLDGDEGGGYLASIPQLGRYAFQGDGETVEEALKELHESKKVLFTEFLAKGVAIPEPKTEEETEYSGKFIVRLPKSLHRSLAVRAESEDVSLNQLVATLLASSAAVHGFDAATKECVKVLEEKVSECSSQLLTLTNDMLSIRYKFFGFELSHQNPSKKLTTKFTDDILLDYQYALQ
jgi:antitoxin HicB